MTRTQDAGSEPPVAPAPSRPYFAIEVFSAIRPDELQRYLALLDLDDNQRGIVRVLYHDYYALDGDHRRAAFPPVIARSADIRAMGSSLQPVVAQTLTDFFVSDVAALWRDLQALEDEFLTDIETMLTEAQLGAFRRVQSQRSRMRAAAVKTYYPWGRLDLADLMWPLMRDADLDAKRQASIDELLVEYDETITPLSLKRMETVRTVKPQVMLLRSSAWISREAVLDEELRSRAAARLRVVEPERHRLNRSYITFAERIHTLNCEFLERLRVALPAEDGEALVRRFREAAYRWVYPNPFDVRDVLDETLAIEGINVDRRTAIVSIAESSDDRQEQICRTMVDLVLRRRKDLAIGQERSREDREAYKARMFELDEKRSELGREALRFLKNTLAPEELSEVAGFIAGREVQMLEAEEFRESRLR